MAELVPYPFSKLITRMFRELDQSDSIFGLPARKFFLGDPDLELGVGFHHHRPSSPLGPAAGPQTQMAQNIVLSWLAGCRVMELKTVQIDDELVIGRPCIDMANVGYNIEWSQELKLAESLEEYVKGSMLIEMLVASGRLEIAPGFDRVVFDMSVGYDLAGIQSEPVMAFMRGMIDATEVVERLRAQIPEAYADLRELKFATRLSDTLTLSTFHGCPPDEIEGIMNFLRDELELHCIVKLNPTLLGRDDANGLLRGVMGYQDIRIPDAAFAEDTTWPQMVAFVERLAERAQERGLGFGVKFNNTLIVHNHLDFFPPADERMYLSGPPLHVLAIELVRRFRRVFQDRLPISFSAGVDRHNFADCVALGLVPVTVCSDLLKPGGYGRAQSYFRNLARRMGEVGARTVGDFVVRAYGHGDEALDAMDPPLAPEDHAACRAALVGGADLQGALHAEVYERLISAAVVLNTEHYANACQGDGRYHQRSNAKPPRKIDSTLELLDCITCDKCVPVCPNHANFTFPLAQREIRVRKADKTGDGWAFRDAGTLDVVEKHQIGNFVDFCNDCGNCDVFCPEWGGPYKLKPRFHASRAAWQAESDRDGFYVGRGHDGDTVSGRIEGQEYHLKIVGGVATFEGEGFHLEFETADLEGTLRGDAEGEVDLTVYHLMDLFRAGVLDEQAVNYLNVDAGKG